jgi:hypothetical protein
MVLQPFHLSLTLSSDKERARKVMSRFEAVPMLLGLRAFSPRYGAADGSTRSDSFYSAVQENRSASIPRRPLALGSVGMTRERRAALSG